MLLFIYLAVMRGLSARASGIALQVLLTTVNVSVNAFNIGKQGVTYFWFLRFNL